MKKWNMIIDVAECTNCQLCTLATMDEYVGNDWPGYTKPMPKHGHKWINILQKERGQIPMIDIAYVPTMCNHCDDAPCVAKGGSAVKKREDGIVLIDSEQAKGRKDLVETCPYGHIWWNEELQLPQAWPFEAHLIDQGWQQTRGHQSCPTGAMRAIKVDGFVTCGLRTIRRPKFTRASARRATAPKQSRSSGRGSLNFGSSATSKASASGIRSPRRSSRASRCDCIPPRDCLMTLRR